MSVKYKELNIKINQEVKEIDFNGVKISVKQYLGVDKKAAIINNAIRGSNISGYSDEVLSDAYLHVMIVENYTDIDFDGEEFGDILAVYDAMQSSGLIDAVISGMDPQEYDYLFDCAQRTKQLSNTYAQSYARAAEIQAELVEQLKPSETE